MLSDNTVGSLVFYLPVHLFQYILARREGILYNFIYFIEELFLISYSELN